MYYTNSEKMLVFIIENTPLCKRINAIIESKMMIVIILTARHIDFFT